jgi:hypothetical protein
MSELLVDRAGRRRSRTTMPGIPRRASAAQQGLRYPADPPKVEEIVAVMRAAGDRAHARRLRALIVLLGITSVYLQGNDSGEIIEPCTSDERR